VKPRRSFGHWRNCEQYVRLHIRPEIGRVALAKLNAADVERLVNATREKGLSDDTVRLVHATLRAALTVAKRRGLVHDNVATLTEPISVRREEVTPFAEDKVGRLLEAARDEPLGAYVTVALALGLRPGEARALMWEDIQLDGAYPCLRVRRAFRRAAGGEELGCSARPCQLATTFGCQIGCQAPPLRAAGLPNLGVYSSCTRNDARVGREGFEPSKAEPADLQSA
jgi:hypothetical protein